MQPLMVLAWELILLKGVPPAGSSTSWMKAKLALSWGNVRRMYHLHFREHTGTLKDHLAKLCWGRACTYGATAMTSTSDASAKPAARCGMLGW